MLELRINSIAGLYRDDWYAYSVDSSFVQNMWNTEEAKWFITTSVLLGVILLGPLWYTGEVW